MKNVVEIYTFGDKNWPALMLCMECYKKGPPWMHYDKTEFKGRVDMTEMEHWDEGQCDNCGKDI